MRRQNPVGRFSDRTEPAESRDNRPDARRSKAEIKGSVREIIPKISAKWNHSWTQVNGIKLLNFRSKIFSILIMIKLKGLPDYFQ